MGIPFAEADKLAKLVPEPVAGQDVRRSREAIEQSRELKAALRRRARCTASCSITPQRSRA